MFCLVNSWDELRLGSAGGCDLSLELGWEEQHKVEFLIEVRVLNILGFSYLLWFKILRHALGFSSLGLCFWPMGLSC